MSDKYCIIQDDLKDCGVCSLLSIIRYYNGDVSKEYLRDLTNTTKEGVSALNLLKASRELGFEAYGIKAKIKDLNEKILPAIAHIIIDEKYPHFVVVYKINYHKNQLLIMDPAIGFKKYSFSSFMKVSTNYYLVMKPKQVIPKLSSNSNYSDSIKMIFSNYKKVFSTIILISIFYMLINIIESYQFKLLYENGNDEIKTIIVVLIVFLIIKLFFSYFRNNLISLFNIILDKTLVKNAFYHIINLPYLYYRNHTNGDLLTRINDLGNVKELISNLFVSIIVDLGLAVIILIVMIRISFLLSMITIISLLLYGLVVFISSNSIKKTIRDNYRSSSIVNNYLVESLSSFETIKNLSIQKYIYKNFLEKYTSYSENLKYLIQRINYEDIFKNLFLSIGNLLIIYIGVLKLNHNELSLSSLITYMSLSNYLIDPVKNMLGLHLKYQNFKESFSRIKEIYNVPCEKENNNRIDFLRGNVEIRNLSYSYNGMDDIIRNITFEIFEGDRVLIYGNSGSGKSTLMKLLIKYLDGNYRGDIKVGGYDLKELDIFTLRKNICYVSQNEYLYTDSVYENITLGRSVKYKKFLDIANNLFIDEIVKNSTLGYNYVIENNGENVSGGEKERILIARSLFQKANIYIYDESFSEIDIEKERIILSYLFKTFPQKTFIIISHRFSNEDLFNKKIKVGDGKYEFVK